MTTATANTPLQKDERVRREGVLKKLLRRPELGALGGAILVWIAFAILAGSKGFLTLSGTANYLAVAAELGIPVRRPQRRLLGSRQVRDRRVGIGRGGFLPRRQALRPALAEQVLPRRGRFGDLHGVAGPGSVASPDARGRRGAARPALRSGVGDRDVSAAGARDARRRNSASAARRASSPSMTALAFMRTACQPCGKPSRGSSREPPDAHSNGMASRARGSRSRATPRE